MAFDDIDQLAVNTLRTLAMDAIEKAKSGHPGAPLGLAPVAWTLFSRVLKHDPADPAWPDRDRFVLSGGHASMLLYGLLHLTGYDLGLEDIKNFRQWGSRTPGHPEVGEVPGVEMTTGPLGQGCATSVGMALAEARLGVEFNDDATPISWKASARRRRHWRGTWGFPSSAGSGTTTGSRSTGRRR